MSDVIHLLAIGSCFTFARLNKPLPAKSPHISASKLSVQPPSLPSFYDKQGSSLISFTTEGLNHSHESLLYVYVGFLWPFLLL